MVDGDLAPRSGSWLWGPLRRGAYDVGFRCAWRVDEHRSYHTTFSDGSVYATGAAPRPILVLTWYPARDCEHSPRMRYQDYFDIAADDIRLHRFSRELADHHRAIAIRQLLGASESALDAEQRRLCDELLATRSAAIRDAPAASGPFPLLVYHPGFGASFEDNAILCEYLASQGYVITSSAYPAASGESLDIDGRDGSMADLACLIAWARQSPTVETGKLGVIGHSGGAHAAISYTAQHATDVGAVVCLDTTQDYYSTLDCRWERLVATALAHRERLTAPILAAANPHAIFQLLDQLDRARRLYVTVSKNLDHEQFISQGILQRVLAHRIELGAAPRRDPEKAEFSRSRLASLWREYQDLCACLLAFLNIHLKSPATSQDERALAGLAPRGGSALSVECVAPGVTRPARYDLRSLAPPAPRQVRSLLDDHGAEATRIVLDRFRHQAPDSAIYHPIFAFSLLYELLARQRTADARALYPLYRACHPDLADRILDTGERFRELGHPGFADRCFDAVVTLEPDHRAAQRRPR